ncbi:BON domain protein [Thalassoglobus neptunius]|uniref:BON domain protein n=1 Tax=Thalassoglobus neptunius TaxID=1938619 RepID=A0A5C5VZV4_9PLAN|nr:BON domain-containing protein [Thalassoglobus neptunius]TWT43032.1 BON domain protein [Thalassoglobus neptunius]
MQSLSIKNRSASARRSFPDATQTTHTNSCDYQQLQKDLRHSFYHEGHHRLNGIEVFVHDDTVVLSGKVSTYYQLQLAQTIAMNSINGMALRNEIEVC